jgi:hypothetical protein
MSAIHCTNCGKSLSPEQAGVPCPNCGCSDRDISVSDQAVLREKSEVAKVLARKHYEIEAGLTQILRITKALQQEVPRSEPIKLLEVNENTFAAGVMPLHFGPVPDSGISFPTVIVEVTPEEFQRIQTHELKLPEGWELGEELPRPLDAVGGN